MTSATSIRAFDMFFNMLVQICMQVHIGQSSSWQSCPASRARKCADEKSHKSSVSANSIEIDLFILYLFLLTACLAYTVENSPSRIEAETVFTVEMSSDRGQFVAVHMYQCSAALAFAMEADSVLYMAGFAYVFKARR